MDGPLDISLGDLVGSSFISFELSLGGSDGSQLRNLVGEELGNPLEPSLDERLGELLVDLVGT